MRHQRATGQPFWGCTRYPRCKGTLPGGAPSPPGTDVATLQATLRQVVRERDTLRAGYKQLLGEVRQIPRVRASPAETLVRELTRLIGVCHPDRWGGESAVATALTQELLAVRERLREGLSG